MPWNRKESPATLCSRVQYVHDIHLSSINQSINQSIHQSIHHTSMLQLLALLSASCPRLPSRCISPLPSNWDPGKQQTPSRCPRMHPFTGPCRLPWCDAPAPAAPPWRVWAFPPAALCRHRKAEPRGRVQLVEYWDKDDAGDHHGDGPKEPQEEGEGEVEAARSHRVEVAPQGEDAAHVRWRQPRSLRAHWDGDKEVDVVGVPDGLQQAAKKKKKKKEREKTKMLLQGFY